MYVWGGAIKIGARPFWGRGVFVFVISNVNIGYHKSLTLSLIENGPFLGTKCAKFYKCNCTFRRRLLMYSRQWCRSLGFGAELIQLMVCGVSGMSIYSKTKQFTPIAYEWEKLQHAKWRNIYRLLNERAHCWLVKSVCLLRLLEAPIPVELRDLCLWLNMRIGWSSVKNVFWMLFEQRESYLWGRSYLKYVI